MPKHSKKRVSRRKSSKTVGGSGAASWAQSVYGGPGQQHAVSSTDHRISMNDPSAPIVVTKGGSALTPAEVGGTHTLALVKGGDGEIEAVPLVPKSEGGGIITDVAVPAVLLYARDSIRKRRLVGLPRLSMRKGKHHRRSRRGSRRGRR
jgi:hypothetical protein